MTPNPSKPVDKAGIVSTLSGQLRAQQVGEPRNLSPATTRTNEGFHRMSTENEPAADAGCVASKNMRGRVQIITDGAHSLKLSSDMPMLQALFDAIPFYVLLVDSAHTILFANAAVRDHLEVDPYEIVGDFCPRVIHGVDGPFEGCPLEECVALGHLVEKEFLDEETGRTLATGIYPTPYRTEAGLAVYLHTARDVTDQRVAEARAERAAEAQSLVNDLLRLSLGAETLDDLLRRAVERIGEIAWLADAPRSAIFLADGPTRTLTMKAASGLEPSVRRACAKLPFGKCLCGQAAATRRTQHSERVHEAHEIHFDDVPQHGHYCVPILSGDLVLGVLSVGVDEGHASDEDELEFLSTVADVLASIIHRKQTEELKEQHERVARSRERMARLGELSAGVAHNIRNPLHGVLGCVKILEGEAIRDEPSSPEILTMMRDGLERIERVTRRLLSFARETTPSLVPTNVADLLEDVLSLTSVQADDKNVSLKIDAEISAQGMLNADWVVEGLTCVVSNAIDASSGGGTVTLSARIDKDDDNERQLWLEVSDTGCGIPESDIPRVQDPFFTTKPVGEGSGLGLAITRRVMTEHGGDLEIDSRVDEGTCVRLRFPLPAVPEEG